MSAAPTIRIQPPRLAKQLPGVFQINKPTEDESEEAIDEAKERRIKQFGADFTQAIRMWTNAQSAEIRRFFWEGVLEDNPGNEHISDYFYYQTYLRRMRAFWQIMNHGQLAKITQPKIMYRGIRFEPVMLQGEGYVLVNVVSNWSESPDVAQSFASAAEGCCLLQAVFPVGTRYYYTGPNGRGEFEFIIPGGSFRQIKPKRQVPILSKWRLETLKDPKATLTMYPLEYIPADQQFPWPDASPSPQTRANYAKLIHLVETLRPKDNPTIPKIKKLC